jgi:hypothetical protein
MQDGYPSAKRGERPPADLCDKLSQRLLGYAKRSEAAERAKTGA